MSPKDICSILPNFHVMFLIDIDIMSKIYEMLLDGSSGFVGPVFSKFDKVLGLPIFDIYNNICKRAPGIYSIVFGVLVSQKINNIGFGARGHVRKSRNHRNDEFEALP